MPDSIGSRACYRPVVGVLIEQVLDLFGNAVQTRTVHAVEGGTSGQIVAAVDLAHEQSGLTFVGVYPLGQHPRPDDPAFGVDE